jgi:hypothetical protein
MKPSSGSAKTKGSLLNMSGRRDPFLLAEQEEDGFMKAETW